MADYSGQSENCLIINFIYSHRNMKYLIVWVGYALATCWISQSPSRNF
jgi:hypothetical protein